MTEPLATPRSHDDAVDGDPTGELPLLARLNRRGFRLVMVMDVVVLYGIAVGTMLVRDGFTWRNYPVPLYLTSFAFVTLLFVATLYFGGLYEREPRLGAPSVLPRAARQTLAAGSTFALLTLVLTPIANELGLTTQRALPIPIINLVVLIVLGAMATATNRRVASMVRTRREGPPKVVVVGDAAELEVARQHLAEDAERVRVVAELTDPSRTVEEVLRTEATDVVLLAREHLDPLYPDVVEALDRAGITVLLRVTARETMFGLERVREVGGLPFVLLRSQTIPVSRARFKRFFDVTVLTVAAPVWLLVLGAVAVHQLIVVGRPLLYWQERVGVAGRPFRMVKFRTMVLDAEAVGGAQLAEREDPRVIPACRWVRATRMDELPQLWNVLRGEMSLVGPRPERPELTAAFERSIPGYARRHELPPGLTGLAQIHGRYHTDAEYKLGYDLQYLVNWSPVLDLEILFRTAWVVIARRI
ncbi:exopolysaccharide biosynthesis polyprenyl glycosylphosphotransferase [Nitriliruptor alkaliphilus]|uniref:exopolysaccharide biosynthesis polyprenyl glycosylphosphotransferase n=1 Tax=Nitriliruptor alkaliphilus TaxID=427918 RepID=UPI0006973F93|nr:exopolysaccharide biosynthesis polyprenyl glycosylphosphotransferase [Nitriliruptor alkaliphilus]